MASTTIRQQFFHKKHASFLHFSQTQLHFSSHVFINKKHNPRWSCNLGEASAPLNLNFEVKASPANDGALTAYDNEEGVSLGTLKLPANTDLGRFETLLFQWANSLCQGANLPLPVPLKVDKIVGGARLGFITVEDGDTQVLVYIDCLVVPATDSSPPIFRAIRNGPSKDQSPPGEPRIMRSLLDALRKCVEIARL